MRRETDSENWGGSRKGAGRKKTGVKRYVFYLAPSDYALLLAFKAKKKLKTLSEAVRMMIRAS